MTKHLLLAAVALSSLSMLGAERAYTFNFDEKKVDFYGTSRKENIDIAVRLDVPALAGFKIEGISVALPGDASAYGDLSAFLTKELTIDLVDGLRVNVPDIAAVEATIADGVLTATFSEPYTLTSEPLYVGYSFSIKELTEEAKAPIAVVDGRNPDGLWFHSNRTSLKWTNYVDKTPAGLQSAMDIILSGDFRPLSASVELPARTMYRTGEEGDYEFTLVNYGSEPISAVECEWKIGEKSGNASCSFPEPLRTTLGARGTAVVSLPGIDAQGEYPVEITAVRLNGKENPDAFSAAQASVVYVDMLPVKLPLVEEYTGLWCGNCPRGYATLEYMKEHYGYQFVAASWHNNDQMEVSTIFPSDVRGFPLAWLDRVKETNPSSAMIPIWEEMRELPADYAISCATEFADPDRSLLSATVKVLPVVGAQDLRIGYLLLADGLSSPSWRQQNYYSGDVSADLPGEWAQFFADAPGVVTGLTYNDVVVDSRYCLGAADALPSSMEPFTTYTHEISFPLDDIRTVAGQVIPVNPEKVRVLAFILDADGKVLNACSSAYPGEPAPDAGVDGVEADPEVAETVWFDLQGRRVAAPSEGLFIRVDTLSDGSRRVSKILK